MQGDSMTLLWLAIVVISVAIEAVTVGLTSIWVAGGALVAMILGMLGLGTFWQLAAFFIVTFVLIFFTRPVAIKHLNSKRVKTNYENVIGKKICIKERVDNIRQTGSAVVSGQEWTVRSSDDNVAFETGQMAEVIRVSGVKLIIKPIEEETK